MGSLLDAAVFAALQDPAPAARLVQSTSQSIPASAFTTVTFQTVDFDTTGGQMTGTPNKLIAPRNGIYVVTGCVVWNASTAGQWYWGGLSLNGVTSTFLDQDNTSSQGGSGWPTAVSPTAVCRLSAGDAVTIVVDQNDSATEATQAGMSQLAMAFVGLA